VDEDRALRLLREERRAAHRGERADGRADAARHALRGARVQRVGLSRSVHGAPRRRAPIHCTHSAASFAWYVRLRSAPARRIEVRISSVTRLPSIHPFCAAAFTMAYSPETL